MKIWIFNEYNMPPEYGHLNRHFYLGKYLKELGHEPSVFVGSFLHNTDIQMINNKRKIMKYNSCDFSYFFIKTNSYQNNRFKRVFNMFLYYKNLLKATKKMDKPDVIIGSSAHPMSAYAAIKLAKKLSCQGIIEIRDLWPESFIAYGVIKKRNPLLKLLYLCEKWLYKKADKIIFTMAGATDYILEKKWDINHGGPINLSKVFHLNNGVDLKTFDYNKQTHVIDDYDLNDEKSFKVIYTGSVRLVNNVDIIIDVAKLLNDENIKFLIWGTGDYLDVLKKRVNDENINNVIFKGWIDKKYIPFILSNSQLNISFGKTKDIFRYGISPNKMFDYFASGKPTLWTFKSNYSLIEKYQSGIEIEYRNPQDLAKSILKFKNLSKSKYVEYCNNARKAAVDYDYKKLTKKLINIIES
jgi:glycosyltransferase involved in cell wall biosynthesis